MGYRCPTMGPEGFEHTAKIHGKQHISKATNAKIDAVRSKNTLNNPELSLIIDAWPDLHPEIQQRILAMVQTASGNDADADE